MYACMHVFFMYVFVLSLFNTVEIGAPPSGGPTSCEGKVLCFLFVDSLSACAA